MKRLCNGCTSLVTEDWPKGDCAAMCTCPKAGEWQGRVVHHQWTRPVGNVIRPAWCPEPERGRIITLGNGEQVLLGV